MDSSSCDLKPDKKTPLTGIDNTVILDLLECCDYLLSGGGNEGRQFWRNTEMQHRLEKHKDKILGAWKEDDRGKIEASILKQVSELNVEEIFLQLINEEDTDDATPKI